MAAIFVVAVLVTSSIVAAAFVRWGLGVSVQRLPHAARRTFEYLGLWLLCLALNIGLGTAAVLLFRTIAARFVSVYLVNDISFVIFSAIQAFVLHAWLSSSERGEA